MTHKPTPRPLSPGALLALSTLLLLICAAPAAAVTIPTVPVGNAGNLADTTGFGAVAYDYRIGTTEVTNAQYAQFLNAKAASDPLALYDTSMGSDPRGGITRSGSSGSYTYAVKSSMDDKPVNYVTWYDAIRFANWMHNGQGSSDTEAGAYTLLGGTPIPSNATSIVRNSGALWFLPSENEWYKAAFHHPAALGGDSDDYWLYPTATNGVPTVATAIDIIGPTRGDIGNPGANVVNYNSSADWNGLDGNVTTVGSAGPLSASFYGTFDQGGNVWEWNESSYSGGTDRGLRGSAFNNLLVAQLSSSPVSFSVLAAGSVHSNGFRVATVPEPGTAVLAGIAAIALLAVGASRIRRSRAQRVVVELILFGATFLFVPLAAHAATIPTVPVGNAGNAGEVQSQGTFGAVGYDYLIATTEVTNAQYAEFLNAKAVSDPLGLYNANMGSDAFGGITQSGVSGSFTYAAKTDMGNKPVNYVSWYDAIRFANWLHNGQGSGDTETGAYTLEGGTATPSNGLTITRNVGATWFLTSEDEWYKGAYYDPTLAGGSGDYWDYPTQSNTAPTIATADSTGDISNPGANVANYSFGADWNSLNGNVTTVGSAGPLSESYYGTSDQGGNLFEWNEALISGSFRALRGGSWGNVSVNLRAASRNELGDPTIEANDIGFRVATVPEPSTLALAGMAAVGLLVVSAARRRHDAGLRNIRWLVAATLALSLVVVGSSAYAGFNYQVYHYFQYNGSASLSDPFSDGDEPPSGPSGASTYTVSQGVFGATRESGGLLELNSDDAAVVGSQLEIETRLTTGTYYFAPNTSDQIVSTAFVQSGLTNDTSLAVRIVDLVDEQHDGAFAGYEVDSLGNVYRTWGDETSSMAALATPGIVPGVRLNINDLNEVSALWDIDGDGSYETSEASFTTLSFDHTLTGAFGVVGLVPEPSTLALAGLGAVGLFFAAGSRVRRARSGRVGRRGRCYLPTSPCHAVKLPGGVAVLAALLVLIASTPAAATKIGVMGDSLSDEYFDDAYGYADNWTVQLVNHRGIDMGPTAVLAGQPGGTWGAPRRTGYEYNWARAGADSVDLIGANGQHTGLAAQIGPEGIDYAVMMIGANDQFTFIFDPYLGIHNGTWTAAQIEDWTDDVAANIDTALGAVLPTGVQLVLFNSPDYGITPLVQNFVHPITGLPTTPAGRQAVSDVLENVLNPKIEAVAQEHHVPYVDLFGALESVFGPQTSLNSTLTIGGVDIYLQETDNFGDNPDAGFVHDEIHPHTSIQGLIANLVMEGLNQGYDANLALFSEEEILTNAGLAYGGSDTLVPQIGNYSDYVVNYVPEPSTLALATCGALGLLFVAARRTPRRLPG